MLRTLVLYHSYDDQTERIARRVGDVLRRIGHPVAVERFDGVTVGDLGAFDAVVVGAPVRYGRHSHALERAIKRSVRQLEERRSAFFSVCLAAGGPGGNPRAARGYVDDFLARTGWQPQEVASVAGALQYSRYGPFKKWMMKAIVGRAGGPTDAGRDYEYTDWAAVEGFARNFAAHLSPPGGRAAA